MKHFISLGLVMTAFMASVPSFALVRELASCTTTDGRYGVSVEDNQGTGFTRASHISATIKDANDHVVGAYAAQVDQRIRSASFGRPGYLDTKTNGSEFLLQGPSTNDRDYLLNATLASGETIVNAEVTCHVFGGSPIGPLF
jgi:hypothetical protein